MKCPHCSIAFSPNFTPTILGSYPQHEGQYSEHGFKTEHTTCPECRRPVVLLRHGRWNPNHPIKVIEDDPDSYVRMIHPAAQMRPCPAGVPEEVKRDFEEACAVLPLSPKASAALSRRCLQQVLVQFRGAKGADLKAQIESFINDQHAPPHIADQLHALRQIGNFAAHPQKDSATGEILPVETAEAEWNLDVLESLFDFVFVQPALAQQRKDALNKKLEAAKKPTI